MKPQYSSTLPSEITTAAFHPNGQLLQVVDLARNLRAIDLTGGPVIDWHITRRDFTQAMSKKIEMQYDPTGQFVMLHSSTRKTSLIFDKRGLPDSSQRSSKPLLNMVSDAACFSPGGPFLWNVNFKTRRLTLRRIDKNVLIVDVALTSKAPAEGSLQISPDGRVVSILDRSQAAQVPYISNDAVEPENHVTHE